MARLTLFIARLRLSILEASWYAPCFEAALQALVVLAAQVLEWWT